MARHQATLLVVLLLAGAVAGPGVATNGVVATGGPVATLGPVATPGSAGNVGAAATGEPAANSGFGATPGSVATDGAASTGGPAATNGLAEFSLKPGGTVTRPGETVPLVVFLRSSPQVASGAFEADFVLAFDTRGLRATNVTRGRFMRQGENTTVRVNQSAVDNEAGVVRFGLARDPPRGGVTGYARFATVTFEVREDAPVGIYDVVFRRASVLLTDGGYQQVATYGANVKVTQGATETATPTATPAPDGGGAALGVAAVLAAAGLLAGVVVLVRRA